MSEPNEGNAASPPSTSPWQALFHIQPKASQTFLVCLVGFATFCVHKGTSLIADGHSAAGGAIVGVAFLAVCAAFWSWQKSQSDVDMQGAAPTVATLPNGLQFSTDSRTLRSALASQNLKGIIEVAYREVLPPADGLVQNGLLIPNSQVAANLQVAAVNEAVLLERAQLGAIMSAQSTMLVSQDANVNRAMADHPSAPELPNTLNTPA